MIVNVFVSEYGIKLHKFVDRVVAKAAAQFVGGVVHDFRNKCMALGKPTEDINDLLLMVLK